MENKNIDQKKQITTQADQSKLEFGKIKIASKSSLLVALAIVALFCGFCIFSFASCTKQIATTFIKEKYQNDNLQHQQNKTEQTAKQQKINK